MANINRLISKSGSNLVKLIGIFLLIYSIITIVQGFYGLRVSFRQGQFGFRYMMLNGRSAMLITGIVEGFPAYRAGLKPGDRILQVNGQSLDPQNMLTLWGDAVAGSQLVLTVQRENQIIQMQLTRKLLPMIDRVIRVLFHLILPALMLAYILVGLWARSVLAKTKNGTNFFWDEIPEEASDIIEEEEKSWALQKGISITIPMISQGEQVGILSIGKKKNNEDFNGDDLEIFQEAAHHTALAIRNIKLQSANLEKKRLEKELEMARNIQTQLIPRQIPVIEGLQVHGENKPCFEVGGDYFDIIPMDEQKAALVIADVSGKGAGAALLMSNLQASLRMAISVALPLKEIIYKINNSIFENSLPSQFITFFIGVWNQQSRSLQYINAGHTPPFILRNNNRIKKLSPTGIVLGIKENQTYKCQNISFATNEILAIYTDGIEEFFNYQLEAFGVERMIKTFKENKRLHPQEIIQKLFKELKKFAGGKESYHCDDLTIIAAKRID